MRAVMRLLNGVGVLVLCGAGTVSAQHPQTREGFWIGFGFGYGSRHESCDGCGSATDGGVSSFLKLGGTLSKSVLLGGSVNAWSKSESGLTETLGNVTASVYYYPAPASGFFVTGGLGLSEYRLSDGGSETSTGWGFTLGAGYDIRVGRNISLTPVTNFAYGGGMSPVGLTGWKQNVIDFGLGITFH